MIIQHLYTLVFSHVVNSTSGPGVTVSNELGCAQMCLEKHDCSSIFYNSVTKTCIASGKRYFYPKGLDSDYGFKYYSQRRDCDYRWSVMGGQCYIVGGEWKTAKEAQVSCEKLGGFLAKTDSMKDDIIIKTIIGATKPQRAWLGGKENDKGEMVWTDGSLVTLDLWDPHRRRQNKNQGTSQQ